MYQGMASCDSFLVDDLATLAELTEKSLLEHLKRRYGEGIIYTYVGDILVAVNPFKYLRLYTDEVHDQYRSVQHRVFVRPHVYALVDSAYQALRRNGQSQCCVVSGESGAGKTETAKFFVQHLLKLCRSKQPALQYQIVESSPLLEAFGNAKTIANDNSSRFGKYLEIYFTTDGVVTGAILSEYLLEKSRVVHHGKGEQNFHVFYYIFAGLSQSELAAFGLSTYDQHRYLAGSGRDVMTKEEQREYQTKFEVLKKCMGVVGFSSQDTLDMLTLIASILHTGDIEFECGPDDVAKTVNREKLARAAELMGLESDHLEQILVSSITITRGETITSFNSVEKACDCRDATAKALYGRLFHWIVTQVNYLLHPEPISSSERTATISILDIFGFENFERNSFEQLCINVANEQLQYYFNQHIFAWEQEEYRKEGIDIKSITFVDNKPLVDLFLQRPVGLFHLLDEESRFPRATDKTLVEKLNKQLGGLVEMYVAMKGGDQRFGIIHYAGQVVYVADRFLEKNRDTLSDNIFTSLQHSRMPLVSEIFSSMHLSNSRRFNTSATFGSRNQRLTRKQSIRQSTRKKSLQRQNSRLLKPSALSSKQSDALGLLPGRSRIERRGSSRRSRKDIHASAPQPAKRVKAALTVGAHFRASLSVLMEKMLNVTPQFVRCIKPNSGKQPMKFDEQFVLKQLRYTGLLETTRIRRQGYPSRLTFAEFLQRYGFIAFPSTAALKKDAKECSYVLQSAGVDDWRVGRTKVFLRYYHSDMLYEALETKTRKVKIVQKMVRGWLSRRQVNQLKAKTKRDAFTLETFLHLIPSPCQAVFDRCLKLMENDTARVLRNREAKRIAHEREQQELQRLDREKELAEKEALNRLHAQAAHEAAQAALRLRQAQERKMLEEKRRRVEEEEKLREEEGRRRAAAAEVARMAAMERSDSTVWCRIVCMERDKQLSDYQVSQNSIVVDGSTGSFDPNRIGFNSLKSTTRRDSKVSKFRQLIGKGVELTRDAEGSVWVVRRSKHPMFIKGWSDSNHCMASEIADNHGLLHRHTPTVVFDFPRFEQWLDVECSMSAYQNQRRIMHMCKIGISFVKDYQQAVDTPCWLEIIFENALAQAKRRGRQSQSSLHSAGSQSPDIASALQAISFRYSTLGKQGSKMPASRQPPVNLHRVLSPESSDLSTSGSFSGDPEDFSVEMPRKEWAKKVYQPDRYVLAAEPFSRPGAAAAMQPDGEREVVVPHRRPSERSRARKAKAKRIVKYALGLH
ncbi:myosin-IIIb-like [Corticium candelabrum]|uniref:myosin-IIIb-like n=1 Tax=Corticium candelabrum TaxID=121492 RepID=UPI002E262BAA|nr:myosin-IIIb-like [Corticium candelabrum]